MKPTSSHLVPPRPHTPGTTSKTTSSPRPLPYGDEVVAESTHQPPKNPTSSHPTGTSSHVNYPHYPGHLYDCPACETRCHCTPGHTTCVYDGPHTPQGS